MRNRKFLAGLQAFDQRATAEIIGFHFVLSCQSSCKQESRFIPFSKRVSGAGVIPNLPVFTLSDEVLDAVSGQFEQQ